MENKSEYLKFSYDEDNDVLTIAGVKYSGDLFRYFGFSPTPGKWVRIISREDGVVTIESRRDPL